MVKLYTKDNCIQCKMTKQWLTKHNIEFTESNVSASKEALAEAKATGYTSMPIMLKNNEVFASGFQPDKLAQL